MSILVQGGGHSERVQLEGGGPGGGRGGLAADNIARQVIRQASNIAN